MRCLDYPFVLSWIQFLNQERQSFLILNFLLMLLVCYLVLQILCVEFPFLVNKITNLVHLSIDRDFILAHILLFLMLILLNVSKQNAVVLADNRLDMVIGMKRRLSVSGRDLV